MTRNDFLAKTLIVAVAAVSALLPVLHVVEAAEDSETVESTVLQAFNLRLQGKSEAARDLLVRRVDAEPKDAAAHYELARTHFYLMDLDRGIESINRALELRPRNPLYHHLRGRLAEYNSVLKHHDPATRAESARQLQMAIDSFSKAVELDPSLHETSLALINLKLKSPRKSGGSAKEAKRLVGELEARSTSAAVEGRCMLLSGKVKRQRRLWEDVVAKEPKDARAYEGLARVCLQAGDSKAAEVHFQRALELDPERSTILLHLARHYFLAKEYDQAQTTIRRFLDRKPAPVVPLRAYAVFILARIQKVQQNHALAEELLAEAKQLDPKLWQTVGTPPSILFTAP